MATYVLEEIKCHKILDGKKMPSAWNLHRSKLGRGERQLWVGHVSKVDQNPQFKDACFLC
jgi:hypothetical protein